MKVCKLDLLSSQNIFLSAKEEIHYRQVYKSNSSIQVKWLINQGMGPAVPLDLYHVLLANTQKSPILTLQSRLAELSINSSTYCKFFMN